jgi:hypothetical protein
MPWVALPPVKEDYEKQSLFYPLARKEVQIQNALKYLNII